MRVGDGASTTRKFCDRSNGNKSPFFRMLHFARTGEVRDQPTQHMMACVACNDSTPETALLTGDAAELGAVQNTQARKEAFSGVGAAEHSQALGFYLVAPVNIQAVQNAWEKVQNEYFRTY